MAWTAPGTAVSGTPITASFWNTSSRDNLNFLHDVNGNEVLASRLSNITSAGDAGNRSDHFLGTSLSGWTQEGTAPTNSAVIYSVLSATPALSGATIWTKPYTPTGALNLHARTRSTSINGSTNFGTVGLLIEDASVGDSTGEAMLVQVDPTANTLNLFSRDAGAYTVRASAGITSVGATWGYLGINRDSSNHWAGYWSPDRVTFYGIGTYTKAFTVAKIGLRFSANSSGQIASADFVDVVQ